MPVNSGATDKADAFCDEASALGWKTEVIRDGEKVTAEATLDDKLISISWRGSACLNETYIETDGHRKKLRNAGAARRKLAEEGSAETSSKSERISRPVKQQKPKKAAAKAAKEKPPPVEPFKSKPKPKTILPFDPKTASDEEILEAVRGKKIVWKNRLSGKFETTRVLAFPKQNHLRIEINGSNERCLTFAEADLSDPRVPEGGFRSIRISAITSVTNK